MESSGSPRPELRATVATVSPFGPRLADLLGSLAVGLASYFLALWIRWGGDVPPELWRQMGNAASAGLIGLLAGGSLVDLWSQQHSLAARIYSTFVASAGSVLFAMASVYAFRVTALPRLTFVVAFGILWFALVAWESIICQNRRGRGSVRPKRPTADGYRAETPQMNVAEALLGGVREFNGGLVLLPSTQELLLAAASFHEDGDQLVLEVRPRACQWPAPILKRTADVLLSLIGIACTLPIWLLAALAIRLDSPGPIFFRQCRVGRGGSIFEVLKFRTMVDEAEASTGPMLASENDRRVTRVGRWLRAFRMDELPQFLNVLRGDMSLVGPRPERPEFVEQFRNSIEGYDLRHLVKPGITGLAQIRGRYDTPVEDKLRFDLAYVFLWSPLLDLKIMLQTIGIMLTPERARGAAETVKPEVDPTNGVPRSAATAGRLTQSTTPDS